MFTELMDSGSGGGAEHELNVAYKNVMNTGTSMSFDVPSDVSQLIVIADAYGGTPSVGISNATSTLLASYSGTTGACGRKIYRVIPTDSTINISVSGAGAGTQVAIAVIY